MKNISNVFLFFLISGIVIRLFTVFYIPVFYAPDEEPHFKYIQYIFINHRLPIANSIIGAKTNDWEYYQPPLYYILCSFFINKSDLLSFYICRLFSVFLFSFTFFFVYKITQKLKFDDFIKNTIFSFFALLPTYIFISSAINNDNLLILLSVITFYLVINLNLNKISSAFILSLWISVSMLTKLSSFVIIFFIFCLFILNFYKNHNKKVILNLFFTGFFSLIFSLIFFVRNYMLYENIIGSNFGNKVVTIWKSFFHMLFYTTNHMIWSFYSVSGIHNDIKPIISPLSYLIFIVFLIGIFRITFEKNKLLMKIFVATLIVNMFFLIWFGYRYGQPQGRFLLPSLLFYASIFSIGYRFVLKKIGWYNKSASRIILPLFLLLGFVLNILKFETYKNQDRLIIIKNSSLKFEQKKISRKTEDY